jgi:hypothetical protein
MKLLFVYKHGYEDMWKDGLWAALKVLEDSGWIIKWQNLEKDGSAVSGHYDFVLGWGAFNSPADLFVKRAPANYKKGLCIAGNAIAPDLENLYDILFHETDWYKQYIEGHRSVSKAFGINTDIFYPQKLPKVWDVLNVGAFALWKRQDLMKNKSGNRMVVGEIQKGNLEESLGIVGNLLMDGVAVSGMVSPENLAVFYNMSKKVYIPSDVNGGGERAVLEARACGVSVEIEGDNPKLLELLEGDIPTQVDYAESLRKGIESCL